MPEPSTRSRITPEGEYYNGFPKRWRKHGRPRKLYKTMYGQKIVVHLHNKVLDELVKKCEELNCDRDEYIERLLVNHVICGDVHEGTLHILEYIAQQKNMSLSQCAQMILRDRLHQMGGELGLLR